jgi:hypothetical protein
MLINRKSTVITKQRIYKQRLSMLEVAFAAGGAR